MPLKLRKNNSLELGSVYNYEDKNFLIIRSDYEKSKAYEISNLEEVNQLKLSAIKNFYNEDAYLVARPKLVKKVGKNFKVGEFIMQDGLIYILDEINNIEIVFTDYPKTSCPIYFFSPIESSLYSLKGFNFIAKKALNTESLDEVHELKPIEPVKDEGVVQLEQTI
jgi:hypothetical protein